MRRTLTPWLLAASAALAQSSVESPPTPQSEASPLAIIIGLSIAVAFGVAVLIWMRRPVK